MILHYAMGSQDKFSNADAHSGSFLTKKLSAIVVSGLLIVITAFAWLYLFVSTSGAKGWDNISVDDGTFYFWHSMTTLQVVTELQFGACALV
jgi:hypothetical protein